jgi:hypothetical protein
MTRRNAEHAGNAEGITNIRLAHAPEFLRERARAGERVPFFLPYALFH